MSPWQKPVCRCRYCGQLYRGVGSSACMGCLHRKMQWEAAALKAEWPEIKAQTMRAAIRAVNT